MIGSMPARAANLCLPRSAGQEQTLVELRICLLVVWSISVGLAFVLFCKLFYIDR